MKNEKCKQEVKRKGPIGRQDPLNQLKSFIFYEKTSNFNANIFYFLKLPKQYAIFFHLTSKTLISKSSYFFQMFSRRAHSQHPSTILFLHNEGLQTLFKTSTPIDNSMFLRFYTLLDFIGLPQLNTCSLFPKTYPI